ncbi:hypothetical protein SS50377_21947 [Spironucleus salmonicida]|uniref:Uncharacterized protein n=1 Tax=Spironucleus salmonicida TaxID=348837 RepID=V6LRU9_9EUKA|nr:hypothetical protein SS50377_21947 [Spironucleus salmonicida]|eukprot:EST46988.1 hypothetical protein SS50377_12940 [Spironucleus salmonicida]
MYPITPTSFTRPQEAYNKMMQFQNVDAQDHYMEVHSFTDLTFSVKTQQVTQTIQATASTIKRPTQTQITSSSYNSTQYEPQLLTEQTLTQKLKDNPLQSAIQRVSAILTDSIYMNQLGDAEYAMLSDQEQYDARGQSTLPEIQALQHAKYSKGKVVSCTTSTNWNNSTIVFQAVVPQGYFESIDEETGLKDTKNEFHVLIWNIADALSPLGVLVSHTAISSIAVSQNKQGLVVSCGTVSGQVLVYDLDSTFKSFYDVIFQQNAPKNSQEAIFNARNNMTFSQSISSNSTPQYFYPSISTSVTHFHTLTITDIQWLPHDCQILRSGELQLSANPMGAIQFVSVSPDGFLKLFSLNCVDRDTTRPDLTVLVPFLTLPMASMFPQVKSLKPVSITFPDSHEPNTNFVLGDAFGNLSFSTWPAAVAGFYALEDEKKRQEKVLSREMTNEANQQLERLQTMYQDNPTKGTCISSFRYFLGAVFKLEFSKINSTMLMAAASDGIKMWVLEKNIHLQSSEMAMRGVVEEQLVLQQDFEAGENAGFVIVEQMPFVSKPYMAAQNIIEEEINLNSPFVEQNALLSHLNMNISSNQTVSDMSSMNVGDLNKRALNQPQILVKSFETDFPNYDFYEPVFSFLINEGSITACCLSQSRVGVVFIGTDRGQILVFDLLDRMYEPLITAQTTVGPVTNMHYFSQAVMSNQISTTVQTDANANFNILPEKKKQRRVDCLLVGDMHGTVHVLEIPSSLKQQKKRAGALVDEKTVHEKSRLRQQFRRCLESVVYMRYRQNVRSRQIDESKQRAIEQEEQKQEQTRQEALKEQEEKAGKKQQ